MEEADDQTLNLQPNSTEDICKTLLDRYAKSSASQHRHLCASACAMRSILSDEGLPFTPEAYFAAVLTSIRGADHNDRDGVAALSALMSILLSLIPAGSVSPVKAKDASLAVLEILKASPDAMATTTVRSLVKCLGFLVLCLDFGDWDAIEAPLEVLLKFSVDRRPKIRKCAQLSIEKAFTAFSTSNVIKKAAKLLLTLFRGYISLNISVDSRKKGSPRSENIEALHLLNVLVLVTPKLQKKATIKFLNEIYKLFGHRFSQFTRHVLALIDVLLEHLGTDELISESDRIISLLSSYVSTKKNPVDTIITTSNLLRKILNKLHQSMPSLWLEIFPLIFSSLAGFLDPKTVIAQRAEDILVELVNCCIHKNIFPTDMEISCSAKLLYSPESAAIISACHLLENMLDTCSGIPSVHMLKVLSQLFCKLGDMSYCFMPKIIHKLAKLVQESEGSASMNDLHECIGCAVIAMGPEKMLCLLPLSLNEKDYTCSNSWIIPILRKFVIGASLKYYVEDIAPLAKSIKSKCKIEKKSQSRKKLQSYIHGLWNLLPAFCHYPIDISQNFDLFARFLTLELKEDSSTHEHILAALQVLVRENRDSFQASQDIRDTNITVDDVADDVIHSNSRYFYTKEVASNNIKTMASCSVDLLQAIINVSFVSPLEKRSYLKEGIESLSSIMGDSDVQDFVFSLLKNFELVFVASKESKDEDSTTHLQPSSMGEDDDKLNEDEKDEKKRCLAMDLVSCFVVRLDHDLVYKVYNCIRHSLLVDRKIHLESYNTLGRILKENCWFSLEKADELINLVNRVKSPSDISILKSRFSCLIYLLIHLMKSQDEEEKKKIFLILNEIILTLKDSDKEVRKTAYDMLLVLASSFRDLQSGNSESHLSQLLTMIIGYFSGSSPQITSGAVAVLSLLIYKDADLCFSVPELVASVLSLLKRKQVEIIKSVLGFIKVLVSSLRANQLSGLLHDIADATLPWSSISKNHFRAKVRLIFEIIMRKCGADSVNMVVPNKYKSFIKAIEEQRQNRATSKKDDNLGAASSDKGVKKRKYVDISCSSHNHAHQSFRKKPMANEPKSRNRPPPFQKERGRRNHMNYDLSKSKSNKGNSRKDEKPRTRTKKMHDKPEDEKPRTRTKKMHDKPEQDRRNSDLSKRKSNKRNARNDEKPRARTKKIQDKPEQDRKRYKSDKFYSADRGAK